MSKNTEIVSILKSFKGRKTIKHSQHSTSDCRTRKMVRFSNVVKVFYYNDEVAVDIYAWYKTVVNDFFNTFKRTRYSIKWMRSYLENYDSVDSDKDDVTACNMSKRDRAACPPQNCMIMNFLDVGNVHVFESAIHRIRYIPPCKRIEGKILLQLIDIYNLIRPCCFPAAYSVLWKKRKVPSIIEAIL